MSFNEFQNDVNGLMDILWSGGVASHATIIEQLNYLMFIRALTKKDDNSIALDPEAEQLFQGELSKYRWDNLLMLNAEALFTTLEELFRKLPEWTSDKTIRQLFQDAHVKIFDKPTLRRVVHEIDKMMVEMDKEYVGGHTDVFGDMYEHLLSKLAQAGTLGQFRTPRHIIDFMVDVVDPEKGETILDPACGTAGFLIAALKHLKEKYTSEEYKKENRLTLDLLKPDERQFLFNNTFTGFDSDFDMFKFGLMNLYLHHLEHPNLKRQNTLVDTAGDRTKWDVILANPPFAGAVDRDSISEDLRMGTRATEVLFLKYMIDHLSPDGRAGVIVPEGIVFSGSNAYKKIRKMLIEDAGLWCVVSLPAGVFNPYAGVKTSILFFDKGKKGLNNEILFVKINNDGFDLGATKKPIEENDLPNALKVINKWKQSDKDESNLSIFVPKEKICNDGNYYLTGEKYKNIVAQNNSEWEMLSIGEVCSLVNGRAFKAEEWSRMEDGGMPIIRIQNLNNPDAKFNYFKGEVDEKIVINNEDLLFSWSGSKGTSFGPHIWNRGRALLNQHIFKVFPTEKINKKYFYWVLKKAVEIVEENLHGGVGLVHITKSDLEKIKIPIPPVRIQEQIVADLDQYKNIIDGANIIVQNWKPGVPENFKWEKVNLEDIATFENGDRGKNYPSKGERVNKGIPFINAGHINDGVLSFEKMEYISEERYSLLGGGKVQENDILFCLRGSLGKIAIVRGINKGAIASSLLIIRPSNSVLPEYLLYFLMSTDADNQIKAAQNGVAQPNLAANSVKKFTIALPPLDIQKQIVDRNESERLLIDAAKKLIEINAIKIHQKIMEVWGEQEN